MFVKYQILVIKNNRKDIYCYAAVYRNLNSYVKFLLSLTSDINIAI